MVDSSYEEARTNMGETTWTDFNLNLSSIVYRKPDEPLHHVCPT